MMLSVQESCERESIDGEYDRHVRLAMCLLIVIANTITGLKSKCYILIGILQRNVWRVLAKLVGNIIRSSAAPAPLMHTDL